jgi:hypothetical protein
MRSPTARAYLDDVVSAAKFDLLVAPNLDARFIAGMLVYTRRSIDDWIERGDRAGGPQTAEQLAKLLDNDDDQNS